MLSAFTRAFVDLNGLRGSRVVCHEKGHKDQLYERSARWRGQIEEARSRITEAKEEKKKRTNGAGFIWRAEQIPCQLHTFIHWWAKPNGMFSLSREDSDQD